MTTITQVITALPTAPDPATDTPANFSTKAAAFVLAQTSMVTEINTWRGQANTVAGEVNTNATNAGNSATAAAASATAAAASETAAAASAASAVNAPGTSATSTTSLAIGTGSKALTIQTGKAFAVGQFVVIAETAAPTSNYMTGQITAHDSGTGSLTVSVTATVGSGTIAAWTISLNPSYPGTSGTSVLKGNGSGGLANATPGTDFVKPDTQSTFTAAQRGSYTTLTDAATVAIDLSANNFFKLLLGGNRTLDVPTNIVAGQSGQIDVYQDGTGSRSLAYSWVYQFAGGTAPTLTTGKYTKDILAYTVDLYKQSTVAITIATPGVVSWASHGLYGGQRVQLTTTGALPTGLSASTSYYVIPVDANSFQLATSLANAQAGTAIATSGSQSGTHTMTACTITIAAIGDVK